MKTIHFLLPVILSGMVSFGSSVHAGFGPDDAALDMRAGTEASASVWSDNTDTPCASADERTNAELSAGGIYTRLHQDASLAACEH